MLGGAPSLILALQSLTCEFRIYEFALVRGTDTVEEIIMRLDHCDLTGQE